MGASRYRLAVHETGDVSEWVAHRNGRPNLIAKKNEVLLTEEQAALLEQLPKEERVQSFANDYMPLVRYRIGDLAERREWPYATEYLVHGRARDALKRK